MKRSKSIFQVLMAVLLVFGALGAFPANQVNAGTQALRISQVYGGGGNSGATFTHDFFEIFNSGSSPVSLADMSIQYASATSTGNFGASAAQLAELPDIMLGAGQYYLIQGASGANGSPLPLTPDVIDATPINASGSAGKVALVNSQASLGCNGSSTPCTPEQLALIVDLVGFGTANFFEGLAAAPGLSNTTAAMRLVGGCTDTDDNSADFESLAPVPRNSTSPTNSCGPVEIFPTELFFSEYIEGSSNNKALEIYNGTEAAMDLSNYQILYFNNGSPIPTITYPLTGTVAAGDVFVLTTDAADPILIVAADLVLAYPSVVHFNGDDALALQKISPLTTLDVIGQIGIDPGTYWGTEPITTAEHTLTRKDTICEGDPDGSDPFDPALEWDGFAQNDFTHIGAHDTNCFPSSAPEVTSTVPLADATGVSPHKPISATFNKSMDVDSLGNFTLIADSDATIISGVMSYDDGTHTATFTPNSALVPNTPYTATFPVTVTDMYGMPLAVEYSWSFTTGALDTTAPVITTKSPLPDAMDVSISTVVSVTFSEDLATSSLNLGHFILTNPASAVVPAAFSYDPITYTVSLDPDPDLAYSTTYTMKVTADTADLAGNPLGADDVWSFTTMAEPEMHAFFGDIHNHTSISDGSGTPAQALAAGEAAGFDFMAISDHSYAIDDGEWASTLAAVNAATDADFVALRGFEYTQGAEGHINVWNTVYHATRTLVSGCTFCVFTPNLEAGTTVQGFYPWVVSPANTALDSAGMVMQFNHPGWINFNDWFFHPEASGIARLEEVGNGNGTSYVFSESEFIRSLDSGWKVGATNNADTHTTEWGTNTENRTGVLMTELTKSTLLEALHLRRTFATEDMNFSLSMKANGAWMGSEIPNTGTINFHIEGVDADGELATLVEVITNQGAVANSWAPNSSNFTLDPQLAISSGVHYYYVKVTQADGDRIVSSPVWTIGTADISITDLTIQPTIPTTHNPSLLSVRVTHRSGEIASVNVVLFVGGVQLGAPVPVTITPNGDSYAFFSWQPTVTGPVTITAEIQGAPVGDNPDDNVKSLDLIVTDQLLPLILIDAGHGNLNTAGNEMKPFIDDLSAHHYNVLKNLDALTTADLNPEVVKLLMISAPETAYTPDELSAIANYVAAGGSLWLGGLADYTGTVKWANTVADRENAILAAIETATSQQINMRMNDDEVIDGNTNNGYVFGVIFQDFPGAASTGIGMNVESVSTWSLSSLRGRTVSQPLTASTPGVQIVMQGDLDVGCTTDYYHNPFHTSNTDADSAGDAYMYNPGFTCALTVPPVDAIPLPAAAVTDLEGTPGRIMLYGDSNDPFTIFAYTAGDGKQNELFNLQSVMWLLGDPLVKSTIAEVRTQAVEDVPDKLDKVVWVEGIVTAGYGEFFNVLYVQDETGGITVHAPAGDIDATSLTRGTKVRVVGTIGIYNGDTEIEFFEAEMVQVLAASTGEPVGLPLTTQEATLESNEGWLTAVSGQVIGKSGLDTLIVNDGSGPVRVFLDGYNGTFDDIQVNDLVQVIGLVSEDGLGSRIRIRNYKFHAGLPDDVILTGHQGFEFFLPVVFR